MKIIRYCPTAFFYFLLSGILLGCLNHSYSGTVTSPSKYPAAIERAKRDKRFMMLHSGINLYSITSVDIDKSKKQMTVQLDKADSLHLAGSKVATGTPLNGIQAASQEMHLYMTDSTSYTLDEPHTIMLDKVARLEWVN